MVVKMSGARNSLEANLFDETVGYDEEAQVRFADGLSPSELRQATILYNLFNELWGVCIVVGDPGTGKDLFGNYLSYKIKRFCPWKRILRDEKPRQLYGEYAGLFNEYVLRDELAKMREVARGKKSMAAQNEAMENAADRWVTEKGEVLLKNSVLYLTEYWRYCYNREPMNPMNKTMGGIHKMKRHLDALIIGTVQLPTDLDKKTCLPWVDWKVSCVRSTRNKTGFIYFVQKVKYDRRMEELTTISKPFPIAVDAGKPISYLGDGKIEIKRRDYEPENEEERVVLEVLKAGINRYEQVVEILENESDMTEWETLETLKMLKFNRGKRAIDYPCWFSIYNSKSAPQMRTSVVVRED